MAHRGLKFGIFLAPFHRVGENPTLAIGRDVECVVLARAVKWFLAHRILLNGYKTVVFK